MNVAKFQFHPLTPDRWLDLEALFGAKGMRRIVVKRDPMGAKIRERF